MTVNAIEGLAGLTGVTGVTGTPAATDLYQQLASGVGNDLGAGSIGTSTGTTGVGGVSGISGIGSDLGSDLGIGSALGVDGTLNTATAAGQAAATRGSDFASAIGNGLQSVDNLDQTAATKAISAADGDLNDVHDYVIAATKAQTAVELTTTLRNKALDSFNTIMGMQL